MVKVKLLVSRTDGGIGSIVEVSAEEAQRLADTGCGEIVRAKKIETASKPKKFEKATK